MFDGLDDIDWESMAGDDDSVEEVPELIRGLVDPDPATREESLDAIYETVYLHGAVDERTVAAVPFLLEALLAPRLPGRGAIAALLSGITDGWADNPAGRRARTLVLEAAPELAGLPADPDPEFRAALPSLLVIAESALPGLAGDLFARLEAEPDPEVRQALLDGLSGLARSTGDSGIAERLLAVDGSAGTRVAALIAVAHIDPMLVPLDDAAGLLERAYAEEAPPEEPAGFVTDTLIGALRQRAEEDRAGRRAPHSARLIDGLTDPLGPRVAERAELLETLLESPYADVAGDALYGAAKLIGRWRGDHRGLVTRIAAFLTHPDVEFAERAAENLRDWGPVAAPAADAVAARLDEFVASGRSWTIRWASSEPTLHPLVTALARCGDERALPYLLEALTLAEPPADTGYLLAGFPEQAERIVAAIMPRLPVSGRAEWDALQSALRVSGAAAGAAVPALLGRPLTDRTAITLGRIGAAASKAVPALRAAVDGEDARLAVRAAGALRRIDGWAGALAVLSARVDGVEGRDALDEIAAMGPDAVAAGPYLATFLDTPAVPPYWQSAAIGLAYWQVTGDLDGALPLVALAWNGNEHTRPEIARRASGTLAVALAPLFEAELAESRRHGLSTNGGSSDTVMRDEALLSDLRRG